MRAEFTQKARADDGMALSIISTGTPLIIKAARAHRRRADHP
jgi:hypothetical protein